MIHYTIYKVDERPLGRSRGKLIDYPISVSVPGVDSYFDVEKEEGDVVIPRGYEITGMFIFPTSSDPLEDECPYGLRKCKLNETAHVSIHIRKVKT